MYLKKMFNQTRTEDRGKRYPHVKIILRINLLPLLACDLLRSRHRFHTG